MKEGVPARELAVMEADAYNTVRSQLHHLCDPRTTLSPDELGVTTLFGASGVTPPTTQPLNLPGSVEEPAVASSQVRSIRNE